MSWGIADTAPEIEKIKAESADYLNGLNSCGVIDYGTYSYAFDFYADLIDKAYSLGKKESKWIPCSERLPNKFEDVWVTDNRGGVAVCHMGHTGWRDTNLDEWMYHLDSIVAWMPYYVPEPYQERGEQE